MGPVGLVGPGQVSLVGPVGPGLVNGSSGSGGSGSGGSGGSAIALGHTIAATARLLHTLLRTPPQRKTRVTRLARIAPIRRTTLGVYRVSR